MTEIRGFMDKVNKDYYRKKELTDKYKMFMAAQMTQKKKILVLSDHPLSPSGVGTQTKYMIEALLKTGRYNGKCCLMLWKIV